MIRYILILILSLLSPSKTSDMYGSDDDRDDDIFTYHRTPKHTLKFNIFDNKKYCILNKSDNRFSIEFDKNCKCKDDYEKCMNNIIHSDSFMKMNWSKYIKNLNISKCYLGNNTLNKINNCFQCEDKYLYVFDRFDIDRCKLIGYIYTVFIFIILFLLFISIYKFTKKVIIKHNRNIEYQRVNDGTTVRLINDSDI